MGTSVASDSCESSLGRAEGRRAVDFGGGGGGGGVVEEDWEGGICGPRLDGGRDIDGFSMAYMVGE